MINKDDLRPEVPREGQFVVVYSYRGGIWAQEFNWFYDNLLVFFDSIDDFEDPGEMDCGYHPILFSDAHPEDIDSKLIQVFTKEDIEDKEK